MPTADPTTEMQIDLEKLKELEPPKLIFEFPEGSGRAPIKMTYGLEMDIRRMLPDPGTAVELLLADPVTQDYIIRRCLTDKNKMITDWNDLIPEEEVDIDMDTRDALVMWAGEHALYFFAKRTLGLAKLGVNLNATIPNRQPQPSPSGSNDSVSSNQSAGALE